MSLSVVTERTNESARSTQAAERGDLSTARVLVVPDLSTTHADIVHSGRHEKPIGDNPPVRLVDSHCHLQADRFDADVDQVIGAARLAGVERILVPGWDPASSRGALELVDRFPFLDAAVGVHPHDADRVDDTTWVDVASLASDPRVIATGETGLDYDRLFSPIPAQLANLRRNLRLAAETGKPAILHCRSAAGQRDAQDALLEEIRAFGATPPPVLIHSFSGPVDYAEAMLELGAAISFSGLSFRAGEESTAEVARRTPPHRILVETDSPYLAPPGAPRRRNEPEWVRITAAWIADLRGQDRDAFGDQLVANYDRVFSTAGRSPAPPRR